ncbi:MAG: carbohydrate-binding family 9-like protein [Bryobacterales bacterium]
MRIALTLLFAAALGAQTLPEYRAGRTLDPIKVDGRLDEFTWAALPRLGQFHNIRGGDVPLTQSAIAWDERNLYAVFVCADRDPWGDMMQRDAHLWDQEVVEVFLDPDADGKNYPELEVSPHNIVVDLLIPAPGAISADEAAKWDIKGLQTAVAKSAAGWTVEMAIPWASLKEAGVKGPPKPGDRWRVGMYRIERPDGLAAYKKGSKMEKSQFLAWAPTKKSFHEPDKFGWVEWVLVP